MTNPNNVNKSKKIWNEVNDRIAQSRQKPQSDIEALLKNGLQSGSSVQLSRYYAAEGVMVFGLGGPPIAGA